MDQIQTYLDNAWVRMVEHIALTKKSLTNKSKKEILRKYDAAIRPNFALWMTGALLCKPNTELAFNAIWDNLNDELRVDENQKLAHPNMLYEFVRQIDCVATPKDYEKVYAHVNNVYSCIGTFSPLRSLVIVTSLEYTSCLFIPFLREIAEDLGAKDFTYPDTHGIVDMVHINQLLSAVSVAIRNYNGNSRELNKDIQLIEELMCAVLS